jgi:magnesium transporter
MPTDLMAVVDALDARLAAAGDNADAVAAAVGGHRPVEIGDALARRPGLATRVAKALAPPELARVLHESSPELQRRLLDAAGPGAADVLDHLPMDEATRVLEHLPVDRRDQLLAAMHDRNRQDVAALLRYPKGSAGRLMTERYPTVDPSLSAGEALVHLRTDQAACEFVTDLYAVDDDGRLVGVVSLRELVMAEPATPVRDLLTLDVIALGPDAKQEEAARTVSRYDFLALPVVDEGNRMLGVITVDDVIDVLVDTSAGELLKLGSAEGGGALNQPYFTVPMWRVVRRRFSWLLMLFVAETATGTVLRHFEGELAQVVALSFFIPLLIGTGGNTGAQTVSTLIRGLALEEIRLRDTARVIRRELVSGLCLGLMLGTVGFFRSLLWHSGVKLSAVVALTLVAVCTWANTIGSLIPLVATRFKIDPAVVSAPLITTLVDATGLAIYLLIAKAILGI